MPVDPHFLIDVMIPAATAAYDIMTDPNPHLPAGFKLVGAIEADRQAAAPAMALANAAQMRAVSAMLANSHIFGLVAFNDATKTAIVAIRGTKSLVDWLADLDALAVPYLAVADAGFVHMGFQLVYEHIRRHVAELLINGCPGVKRVLVTGHSLGGAVATLCAFDIGKNLPLGAVPELYTFAAPRSGAPPTLIEQFNAFIPICHRVVNFMDVVPHVPLPPLFEHVGEELQVQGGFRPLDVTFAHHLTTYFAGLQKLVQAPKAAGAGGH